GVWNILDAHLALALPCECLHLRDDRHPGQDGTGDGASGITVITAWRGTVRMPGLSGSGQRSPRWRGAWSKITLVFVAATSSRRLRVSETSSSIATESRTATWRRKSRSPATKYTCRVAVSFSRYRWNCRRSPRAWAWRRMAISASRDRPIA